MLHKYIDILVIIITRLVVDEVLNDGINIDVDVYEIYD